MRPIVSYADITPTPQDCEDTAANIHAEMTRNNDTLANHSWGKLEKSRELTHEEIWDDSALIEAWNAATEEYEVMNGPGKSWKQDPIHKSPLWYNVPPLKKLRNVSATVSVPSASVDNFPVNHDNAEDDSQPIDFATYVPSYNPNLGASEPLRTITKPQNLKGVGRDEAFSYAMNAMYWAGYWTAIYHSWENVDQEALEDAGTGDTEEV